MNDYYYYYERVASGGRCLWPSSAGVFVFVVVVVLVGGREAKNSIDDLVWPFLFPETLKLGIDYMWSSGSSITEGNPSHRHPNPASSHTIIGRRIRSFVLRLSFSLAYNEYKY